MAGAQCGELVQHHMSVQSCPPSLSLSCSPCHHPSLFPSLHRQRLMDRRWQGHVAILQHGGNPVQERAWIPSGFISHELHCLQVPLGHVHEVFFFFFFPHLLSAHSSKASCSCTGCLLSCFISARAVLALLAALHLAMVDANSLTWGAPILAPPKCCQLSPPCTDIMHIKDARKGLGS